MAYCWFVCLLFSLRLAGGFWPFGLFGPFGILCCWVLFWWLVLLLCSFVFLAACCFPSGFPFLVPCLFVGLLWSLVGWAIGLVFMLEVVFGGCSCVCALLFSGASLVFLLLWPCCCIKPVLSGSRFAVSLLYLLVVSNFTSRYLFLLLCRLQLGFLVFGSFSLWLLKFWS